MLLTDDVCEVRALELRGCGTVQHRHLRGERHGTENVSGEAGEALDGKDVDSGDQRSLTGIHGGHEGAHHPALPGQGHHGKHTVNRSNVAVEGEFPEEDGVVEFPHNLAAGGEDSHRDGQVVGRALFAEVGRGQVDDDA